ncbi:alpha/beta hydrolase [Archangium violaceum]|uniref:Alpha/beta hydrolase n=1 Tax=Archangium violaceum Cb vi76 TaxID=1406225 RepID=A0A084SJW9_9BACT|nr:alpha/beta hydrolase [Archangium violaceum]KFA88754.1 alpha/beta hydrolase [Archangium violaceum Cb vi76]
MKPTANPFHPDLQRAARFLPNVTANRPLLAMVRFLGRFRPAPRVPQDEAVAVEDVRVPGPAGAPPVRVRTYRPRKAQGPTPALLWIHGGGYIIGQPEQDDALCLDFARELGIVVVSVDYRLAPENPFPAPLEDCYAALRWLFAQAGTLGVLPERIAIGGASAGGGLTAALAQLAHDRKEVRPAFQLLVYPMLDDRTTTRTDIDGTSLRLWSQGSNVFGWRSYLGREPGGAEVPAHAVPARREDLSGLPPAWMGVGTCDLFHDEDIAYARRLEAAGVPCDVTVVPGAFHGFDVVTRDAGVAREFRGVYTAALRRALFPAPGDAGHAKAG